MKKIIFINILILFLLITFIEIIFGYWFKENNFGFYMRTERNKNILYKTNHEKKKSEHHYIRNFYGFRGDEVDPSDIKVIFEGGSTGNQRFTPEKFTIVGLLNNYLKEDGVNLMIHNASTDGKSTRGINYDFLYWFPKIPDFKPKIFIFYIGINDIGQGAYGDDYKAASNLHKKLRDYIRNNSIIFILQQKFEDKYFVKTKAAYNITSIEKGLYDNYSFVNYQEAKIKFFSQEKSQNEKQMINFFNYKLENLKKNIIKNKIIPMFITQIQFDGSSDKNLFLINEQTKNFAEKNNYYIIKLDEMIKSMDLNTFFDYIHTSQLGSRKIAKMIYPDLNKIIKKELFDK